MSVSADRCIHIWDPYGSEPVTTLRGHTGEIGAMAGTRSGLTIFTAAADRTIKQWQPLRAMRRETLPTAGGSTHLAGLSADSQTVATVLDGALTFWKIGNENEDFSVQRTAITGIPALPGQPALGRGMAVVSPDLKWLATTRVKGPLELWDVAVNQRHALTDELNTFVYAAFSPDSRLLAIRRESRVAVLTVLPAHEVASIPLPEGTDWGIPFTFAAQTNVLGIGRVGNVLLWDTKRERPIREIPICHSNFPTCFA